VRKRYWTLLLAGIGVLTFFCLPPPPVNGLLVTGGHGRLVVLLDAGQLHLGSIL
jgi:hypothetical protein